MDEKNNKKERLSRSKPLVTIPTTIEGPNKQPLMKISGQLVDASLSHHKITDPQQFSYNSIQDNSLIEKILSEEISYVGIDLTKEEYKLVTALIQLLNEKSNTTNSSSPDFFSGNFQGERGLVSWGEEKLSPPHLELKIGEIVKSYLGEDKYSGRNKKEALQVLNSLKEKKFFFKYKRARKEKGKTVYDIIEKHTPLIQIISEAFGLSEEEVKRYEKGDQKIRAEKQRLVIALNPIFIDNIGEKYVLVPKDITRMIRKASPTGRPTKALNQLSTYLYRHLSSKNWGEDHEIGNLKIISLLGLDKYHEAGRAQKVQEEIEKAMEGCKALGQIIDWKTSPALSGQIKYCFKLNPNWKND